MNSSLEFLLNRASAEQIAEHLKRCDADFVPPLSGRVELRDYAQKIASNAIRFEAWSEDTLIGLVASYCNDQEKCIAYITSVSILKAWIGKGIATTLMSLCIEHAKASGMRQISLEVASDNAPAIKLYEKSGFVLGKVGKSFVTMNLNLKRGGNHEQQA